MKPEAQHIALAALDGWEHDPLYNAGYGGWSNPRLGQQTSSCACPPDYLNDLNAIARLEDRLTPTQLALYDAELHRALYRSHMSLRHQQRLPVVRATAGQRCEAILRATNRWVENDR